ncbi:syntaxin-41-like [Carya illinoinensis]|uniref:syntaxin-41-like n=1 Tax=Carya illinoinensis TaxID=32201 RepID=UPI001C720843|nr:syntaxin-41-like [Carya illinoinensis]
MESVNELVQIMKDLSVLVIDQGTIVDRIDYNIQNVATTVEEGLKQLQKVHSSFLVFPLLWNLFRASCFVYQFILDALGLQAERTRKHGGVVRCATVLIIMCFIMLVALILKEIFL